jgi:hypothetical protein
MAHKAKAIKHERRRDYERRELWQLGFALGQMLRDVPPHDEVARTIELCALLVEAVQNRQSERLERMLER